jgi:hypothetical protein
VKISFVATVSLLFMRRFLIEPCGPSDDEEEEEEGEEIPH